MCHWHSLISFLCRPTAYYKIQSVVLGQSEYSTCFYCTLFWYSVHAEAALTWTLQRLNAQQRHLTATTLTCSQLSLTWWDTLDSLCFPCSLNIWLAEFGHVILISPAIHCDPAKYCNYLYIQFRRLPVWTGFFMHWAFCFPEITTVPFRTAKVFMYIL